MLPRSSRTLFSTEAATHPYRMGRLRKAKERNGAAKVITQEGTRLQVEHKGERLTVPMRGFPPGFTLRPGARVVLYDESSGPVARPLVRAVRSRIRREDVEKRGALEIEGRRLEMQDSTVLEEAQPRGEERPSDEYEVWIVERAEGDATEQVIAARRRR